MNVHVLSFSDHHVLAEVKEEWREGRTWYACGVNGWPERQNKQKTWDLMNSLRAEVRGPIIFFGDFNEILWGREKEDGNPRADRDMDAFRTCLDVCGVVDLGFRGSMFTWCRGSQASNLI